MSERINIAIDGPAGAGKSTVAKRISKELNILYLDTGAMYRAMAVKAINSGVDISDIKMVENMLKDTSITVEYIDGIQHTLLDGTDVTGQLRTPEAGKGASDIAVHPCVRIKLVEEQRKIAKSSDVIIDGRDVGSYIIPDTKYKFYLDASPEERARRRYEQNEHTELGNTVSLEQLEKDIIARDKVDSTREFAPLTLVPDAIYINTTSMSEDQVVSCMLDCIRNR